MTAAVVVVVVGHIWNVCKVSGIRAMPSHVNNQKLQPRFQRVSGHTPLTCVAFTFMRPIDRAPAIAGPIYGAAVPYVCVPRLRVCIDSRAHTRPPFIYRAARCG